MRRMRGFGWIVMAMAALAPPACSGSGDVLAPYQPQIANVTDNFQFQVTGLSGVTVAREYTWTNTGQKADVNQATQLNGGNAVLTVRDAALTQVYSQSLAANGTFQTLTGTPGTWRIRVELANATGTVNFRVQKHP